jgi:hypothetical protein
MKTRRVVVNGLREADVATLRVLTQDVLALPLNQIDALTFCDLVALSELEEGLPSDLSRDLASFRESRFREVADLPDGPVLAEFVGLLASVEAAKIPNAVREALRGLMPDRTEPESLEAFESLMSHVETEVPASVSVAAAKETAPSKAEKAIQDRGPAKKPAKKSRTSSTAKDPARAEWIEEYVLARLVNYETGLKEAVIVGGARFKAPWKDVTEREVRSVLRRLGREGKVRTTVGRWLIER